jgi:hypothetical protein
MKHTSFLRSRTVAVVAGAALLVTLGGVSGAVGAKLITSGDIKNGAVKKADIGRKAVGRSEIRSGVVGFGKLGSGVNRAIDEGKTGPQGPAGPRGPQGPAGPASSTTYAGPEWSVIDRNTLENGDAYLRAGPSSEAFGAPFAPPLGEGSLGLRTGSGSDKIAFGNQVDFAGDALSGLNTVKYSVFTTNENIDIAAGNLPNVTLEIDRDSTNSALDYSSLVFTPPAQDAGWHEIDASTASGWYLTSPGTSGCTQSSPCTLAEVKADLPDAAIQTVALAKGRDNAFVGAVDALVWNSTTYDFEPFGVTASN